MSVSVVIPAYNSAKTIRAALDSVFRQTLAAEEVLVFDDGSTDNTAEIVSSYEPRVTLIRARHEGVSYGRNLLCNQAKSDLIAFLDSDDVWHPRYLEFQWRLRQKHPAGVVYFMNHVDFYGMGTNAWDESGALSESEIEIIP